MATRNRKKKKHTGHIVPAPFAILMVLASSLSLGYLWLGSRCEGLGQEIKALEATHAALARKCLYEESRWANMKAPGQIEKALRRHRLPLTWPSRDQLILVRSSQMAAALAEQAAVATVAMND
jgi:hypothetical protein